MLSIDNIFRGIEIRIWTSFEVHYFATINFCYYFKLLNVF